MFIIRRFQSYLDIMLCQWDSSQHFEAPQCLHLLSPAVQTEQSCLEWHRWCGQWKDSGWQANGVAVISTGWEAGVQATMDSQFVCCSAS